MIVAITGAGQGLGLEMLRQYLARGASVAALCRDPEASSQNLEPLLAKYPDRLEVVGLDLADPAEIAGLPGRWSSSQPISVLVHNAGTFPAGPESFGQIDAAEFLRVIQVNTIAPALLTQVLSQRLLAAKGAKVIGITSGAGVMIEGAEPPGGSHSYAMSKAGLHILLRRLAHELKPTGIIVAGMAPGFVLTRMTRGASPPPRLNPEESVRGMIDMIGRLTMSDTGRFLAWDGSECAWFADSPARNPVTSNRR